MENTTQQMTFPEFIDRVIDTEIKDRKKTILVFDREHKPHCIEIEAVASFVKEFDEEDQFRTVQIIAALDFTKMKIITWLRMVAKDMVLAGLHKD